ncbi:histidine kinase [Lyngbya confervoides]|uniref:Adaptive-response sensory-kinase SasA n=1 Tax=Lyngbya confervoides BDU141951 TaxID=1574623 RepID=A0ABD4T960_9CYAN|nr:histidine kinase [Lyngbya confervoides]MCM1984983.1 histidine kinase [Lyngbya confervoides BDU141951]
MTESSPPFSNSEPHSAPGLQLLLFVDQRTLALERTGEVIEYLNQLQAQEDFHLEIVDVHDRPYLAEHFKLIATPALVKTYPPPRHILAGSSLIRQLEDCWPKWQESLILRDGAGRTLDEDFVSDSFAQSVQLMQLADEMFRLRQENEALKDQLSFKDRMITVLAHDLRNPLTAAAIAIETLETQWSETKAKHRLQPATLSRLLHQAQIQIQNIDRMITNLLEASRGRLDSLQIQPKRLNLRDLCLEILEDVAASLRQKSLDLATDIPADIPDVHADADQIRQVFMNLLDNAVKYTPFKGQITVTVLHRTTQKVQVSICDNGPGIPLEKQATIFEDSVRLERDVNKEGYGIGLALCRRIIRAHYGQIWVDSSTKEGSCFNFTLPVYR